MRPVLYLTGRGKPHRWTVRDRVLAEALQYLDASLNGVGLPPWVARDSDRRFVVDEVMDYAMGVLEQAQKDEKNPAPGMRLVVLDQGAASGAGAAP